MTMVTNIGCYAGADLAAAIASLAVESGEIQRDGAADARSAEEALAQSQAQSEVDALRSEAGSMRNQAVFDGAVAFLQCTAGGKSTTVGAVLGGVKGAGDGLYGATEKDDEASAKGFEAGAAAAQSGAQGAHDAVASADQLIQSGLELYKEYVATEAQTSSAVAGKV
jgi:hypothetical protein